MKLHLLEPYRSALVAQAVSEKFITVYPETAAADSPAFKVAGTPDLISEALQLSVLATDVTMVWTDSEEVAKKRNIEYMKSNGLENLGIVKFVTTLSTLETDKWKTASEIGDVWTAHSDFIDTYQDFILTQLRARGKPIHWSLFRLLRSIRLHQTRATQIILSSIPHEYQEDAKFILSQHPLTLLAFDLPILMTISELKMTFEHALANETKIAGAPVTATQLQQPKDYGSASRQIWALLIDKLVQEEIEFPLPTKLTEVLKLRNEKEVVDFRALLLPFLDSVVQGDTNALSRLGKEVSRSARAFRRFPATRKLANLVGYASIGLGVAEAYTGLVGPSIGIGLFSVGLGALAHKWEKTSSWIFLANHSRQ